MKKLFTLIIVSFVATSMFAQQPLNPSFETWAAAATGELPDSWDGTNLDLSLATSECVFKDDTDPQEGTYSARLVTDIVNILGNDVVVPGIITLGTITVDLSAPTPLVISGGMPYTERPDQFTGWYKYSPMNSDTAVIGIAFYNGTDTICEDSLLITDTKTTWTQFTINLNYTESITPDTINIIFSSSHSQNEDFDGSVFSIDNLEFVGGTLSVPQNLFNNKAFSISPNPANTFVNINVPNANNNVKIVLHNTVGQVVYSNTFNNVNEVKERIDISEYNSGIYFVEIINGNKSSIEKLIIK